MTHPVRAALLAGLFAASSAAQATEPAPASHAQAVLPAAIAPKYSKETPGKARMHTCRDQYAANKSTNANGGMSWIQKGGGYYSTCLKKLKAK
jgi:hypothetical protein